MPDKAYKVYIIYSIATACLFTMAFTVSSIYMVTTAHLNPLQLVLVGTVLEASVFIFEIPTGLIADQYSRRLSVIIGVTLIGIGFLVEGSFPIFVPILIAQVLWGVGYTFTSGALQAWITDEIGENQAGPAFLRGEQTSQFGSLAGIILGTLIGLKQINLPILVSGVLFILFALYLMWVMPENGFRPASENERNTWSGLYNTFQKGISLIRRRPALQNILWVGLFYGLYSEGFDRLWVAYLLERFQFPYAAPVVWFGILSGTSMLLSAGVIEVIQQRIDVNQQKALSGSLAVCTVGLIFSLVLFSLTPLLGVAFLAYIGVSIFRNLISPLYTTWVNRRLDSQARATILSMSSQVDACGQIVGGPVIGLIALRISIQAGLLASAAILTPVLALIRKQNVPETDSIPGTNL